MKLFGLIGEKLGHSFSKDFFSLKFQQLGINAEYRNFELTDIGELMELLSEYPEINGLNVTIPFKQQVIPYIDSLSPEASQIGAVNVIKIVHGSSGQLTLKGYNTDAEGFSLDLKPMLPTNYYPAKALVLGSGGASKAVCHALTNLGIAPTVVSRHPGESRIPYDGLTPQIMDSHSVIVNTTPLGMWPHTDSCPQIPYSLITPRHICYDLVYNPFPTLFLEKCRAQGAIVKGGTGMLINQAELAWNIWNNKNL